MIVDNRVHIGPLFIDGAVNIPFAIGVLSRRSVASPSRVNSTISSLVNQLRRTGHRQEILFRIIGMTDADMAKRVDDPFTGQNPIGDDQFAQACHQRIHLNLPIIFNTVAAA